MQKTSIKKYMIAALVCAALLFVDQWTKQMAINYLLGGYDITLIPGVLELHYLENTGAAFSIMENKTFEFVTFAVLIESLITYINQFFVQENFCWQMVLSLILGIVIAVAYKLDLPAHFNLTSKIPYFGCVLTGILLSRGSNYIFDLFDKFNCLLKNF